MTAWWGQPIPDLLLWMLIAGLVFLLVSLVTSLLVGRWFRHMRDMDERDGLPPH
jgi:membrane protein implicated in regulation of membrane protease activity